MDRKKFGMGLMAALLVAMFFLYYLASGHQNEEEVLVRGQLDAIEENRLTEAYYAFTSKDFQSATPLDRFKKFLLSFPILTKPHTVVLEPQGTPGKVKALIKTDQNELMFLYTLQQQDKKWKIQKIETVGQEEQGPDFDASIFLEPVKNHIEKLKENNIEKAYHEYTAGAFQEATSLKEFTEFVKDFPIFSESVKVDYKNLTFNNNVGTYEVLMTGANGTIYDLKYDLIAENGVWKILQIQISESVEEE